MTHEGQENSQAMNANDDEGVLQAYRTASGLLDEAPSAQSRSAILAAAARAAGARPQPLGRSRRWRLPLAAAASVLVGTLAVLLATQVERSEPGTAATAAAEKSAPEPAQVKPASPADLNPRAGQAGRAQPWGRAEERASADTASSEPAARDNALSPQITSPPGQPSASREKRSAPQATPRPALSATPPAAPGPAEEATPAAPASDTRAASGPPARSETARAKAVDSAPAMAETAGVAPPASPAAAPAVVGAAADTAPPSAPSAPPPGVGQRAAAQARTDAAASAAMPWRATPQRWIERIIELRTDGRHAEADIELTAFRARHPHWQVPSAALPPAGR